MCVCVAAVCLGLTFWMYLYIVNNLGIKGRVPSKGNVVAACNLEDKNNDSAYAPALADNIVSTLIRIGLNAVYV